MAEMFDPLIPKIGVVTDIRIDTPDLPRSYPRRKKSV